MFVFYAIIYYLRKQEKYEQKFGIIKRYFFANIK